MKTTLKTLFVTLFIVVISCSKDKNVDPSGSNQHKITPPAWIIGDWKSQYSSSRDYSFKTNDFCLGSVYSEVCLQGQLDLEKELGMPENMRKKIEQKITNDFYSLKLIYPGGSSNLFEFRRISSNEIKVVSDGSEGASLYKM